MKKFFAMLLALVMALSLVACGQQGGQQDNDGDQPASNDAPVAYVLAEKGDTYSLGLASNFQTAFEKLGGTVVMETFPTKCTKEALRRRRRATFSSLIRCPWRRYCR